MTLLKYIDIKDVNIVLKKISPSRYNAKTPFGKIGVQSPISVIDGKNIKVHEVALGILLYHAPPPKRILDPTCGKENYHFSYWIEKGILKKLGYEYISGDIKPYGDVVLDVLKGLPFKDNSFDVVFYDPPYTINARIDDRGDDYDIKIERHISEIEKYYSAKVHKEFSRVLKEGGILIEKGTDQYYPRKSDNLIPFLYITDFKEYFRPVALYIYRFLYDNIPLLRYRMRNWNRPLVTHTYFLVLKKEVV